MNNINTSPQFIRQRGLGLVEIMVALVIGLIVMGALSYFLIGGRMMNRVDDDVSRMQENGRYAMDIIGRAVRQAGYRLDPIRTLGATVAAPSGVPAIEGTNGAGSAPDTITLRHDPAWVPHVSNPIQGEEMNCTGAKITSDNSGGSVNSKLIVYQFSIVSGNLSCTTVTQAGGSDSAIVASGVEDMQIEYGLDTVGNGVITSYITATDLDTDVKRSQVAAVRVSLLLKGANKNTATGTQTINFNGTSTDKTDGYLRQVYTSTITVRNQAK